MLTHSKQIWMSGCMSAAHEGEIEREREREIGAEKGRYICVFEKEILYLCCQPDWAQLHGITDTFLSSPCS